MTTVRESLPSTGPTFQSIAMCGASALTIFRESTCSPADFRASRTASLVGDAAAPMSETSGPNTRDLFASLGPDTSWLKTYQDYYQLTMDGSLEAYSGTWPRSGTLSNGQCFLRAPWVPHTHVKECSLWPTPMASTGRGGGSAREAQRVLDKIPRASGKLGQLRLEDLWKLRTKMAKGVKFIEFTEALMGFPLGWTDCEG